jgi:fructokinase
MFGAIEAGGTKFICGIGTGPDDLVVAQFPTTTPDITVANVTKFFKEEAGDRLESIGIGSFGPVDLNTSSPHYGYITSTPKKGWNNYDLVGTIKAELKVPITFETDVNAALLGEVEWGAAKGLTDAIYLTIGTGIGGGVMAHGQMVHGLVHPEIGHLRVPHDMVRDPFPGICPYHRDCLEGLACGPAIQARWKAPAGVLPPDHHAWNLEAHYLALALANLTFTLSPQRILMGGGVMQQPQLFDMTRIEFSGLLNGYVRHATILSHLDQYIQPPALAGNSGVLGALWLAMHGESRIATASLVNERKSA